MLPPYPDQLPKASVLDPLLRSSAITASVKQAVEMLAPWFGSARAVGASPAGVVYELSCYPARETMAARIGRTVRTVARRLAVLRNAGALERSRRRRTSSLSVLRVTLSNHTIAAIIGERLSSRPQRGASHTGTAYSLLVAAGIDPAPAAALSRRFTLERIQAVCAAALDRPAIRNRPGWIRAALNHNWRFRSKRE